MMPLRNEARPLAIRSVARSHVGLVRSINEDRVFDCPERGLFAVADGMGGHSGGDLAAQAVIDAFRALVAASAALGDAALLDAIRRANQAIVTRNLAQRIDAGSTIVAAHIAADKATIAWVGDSRAYLIRDGALTPLTRDHSVVQELIDAGLLTAAAAVRHPNANVVTRALGVSALVDIDTITVDLAPGDRLLLCSDGLSRALPARPVQQDVALHAMADLLLSNSLRDDGSDNISFICVELTV